VWSSLWSRGRVDVSGDLSLARAAYAAWYYLLSSLPLSYQTQFVGVSPGGLPLSSTQVINYSTLPTGTIYIYSVTLCRQLVLYTLTHCMLASSTIFYCHCLSSIRNSLWLSVVADCLSQPLR